MEWPFRALSYSKNRPSRLLDLPTEIRDLIFAFALTSEKPLVAFKLDDYQRDSYKEATQPPLTQVNRQIRHESLPIFYDCNDIILHTDSSKATDTRRWLTCVETRLDKLQRLSFWIRYVTLTNHWSASNGAISIFLQRSKAEGVWKVEDRWKWITVTRKPSIAERDARFLISELRKMLVEDCERLESAQGVFETMVDLKMLYVKEKMS